MFDYIISVSSKKNLSHMNGDGTRNMKINIYKAGY